MSEPAEDPGGEFLAYLHAGATQVTSTALRARAVREQRQRDQVRSRRNRFFDLSQARGDARSEAGAARRTAEHEARMQLHRTRLAETLERVQAAQEARRFAASAGEARQYQHEFDQVVGSFAAAVATEDLSPQHAELARLMGKQLREQTGLDPEKVAADARQRFIEGPGWVDLGHVAAAELAEVMTEMRFDDARADRPQPAPGGEGTDIAEHLARARVGHPPLAADADAVFVPSERVEGLDLAPPAEVIPVTEPDREFGP
ncbi:hypothetical protein [Nocardia sp. alder85J]|uniref:hypothetical protein n=1 Tax=Nocardia sp. alder85J TaxID=2862949 RepID=UPI001CD7BF79|nr:hypothetical protein [Nocardia sp. alder85J]MCX4098418.1 hypothetical protein [Nocardia sp. alder85J]